MPIKAFAGAVINTGNTEATLRIYGAGELESKLNKLIKRLGMTERIEIPGRTQDLPAAYAESDCFVLSSRFEGQPNALMEAMFAGLPCISTDCPCGPSDFVEDKKNGLLVPSDDLDAMREAIEYMMTHPEEASGMGREAKEYMTENYNAEAIARRFVEECAALKNRVI